MKHRQRARSLKAIRTYCHIFYDFFFNNVEKIDS